jgi:hypothetical protein
MFEHPPATIVDTAFQELQTHTRAQELDYAPHAKLAFGSFLPCSTAHLLWAEPLFSD